MLCLCLFCFVLFEFEFVILEQFLIVELDFQFKVNQIRNPPLISPSLRFKKEEEEEQSKILFQTSIDRKVFKFLINNSMCFISPLPYPSFKYDLFLKWVNQYLLLLLVEYLN